jgi:hypothetical protein
MLRYLLEGLAVYVVVKQRLVSGRIKQTETGKKNGMRPRPTLGGGGVRVFMSFLSISTEFVSSVVKETNQRQRWNPRGFLETLTTVELSCFSLVVPNILSALSYETYSNSLLLLFSIKQRIKLCTLLILILK